MDPGKHKWHKPGWEHPGWDWEDAELGTNEAKLSIKSSMMDVSGEDWMVFLQLYFTIAQFI